MTDEKTPGRDDVLFPGTVLPRQGKTARALFDSLFFAANGLLLMQIREITGLDTPVLQNWVSREWIPRPVNKRYDAHHVGRILIINMLRGAARMEDIAHLMVYINGDTNNRADDIIAENELYIYLCEVLDAVGLDGLLSGDRLDAEIDRVIANYTERSAGARAQLHDGMRVMLSYYLAAQCRTRADRQLGLLPRETAGTAHQK